MNTIKSPENRQGPKLTDAYVRISRAYCGIAFVIVTLLSWHLMPKYKQSAQLKQGIAFTIMGLVAGIGLFIRRSPYRSYVLGTACIILGLSWLLSLLMPVRFVAWVTPLLFLALAFFIWSIWTDLAANRAARNKKKSEL